MQTSTEAEAESLLHSLEQAAGGINLPMIAHKRSACALIKKDISSL